MSKYGIVVIGYNRIDSLQRLMRSLLLASYPQKVDLIISIDNSGTDIVEKYAKTVEWAHGEKIIKTYPERMGLKKHVLNCGTYLNEYDYDAIAVLEDDLFVSPGFFEYMIQTVEFYKDNDAIAGISLYTHSWNINADRPFMPIYKGYDVFYLQYPQSWGQIWMKRQWNDFYSWYEESKYEQLDLSYIPDNVLAWPASSWLKFHVEYCIDRNKFFVYPYQSLTTNFADAGTHYAFSTNKMQVPLNSGVGKKYIFPKLFEYTSVYDCYYEDMQLSKAVGVEEDELVVDLYSKKKVYSKNAKYLLSTKPLEYKILKTYGLQMRPWELNVIYEIPGEEIYLYDLSSCNKEQKVKYNSIIHWIYDTRGEKIMKHNFIGIIFNEIYSRMKRR